MIDQVSAPNQTDRYDLAAARLLPTLTAATLAELIRQKDEEHRQSVRVVSALLELLGGQAFLPGHALKDAPGYQALPGEHSGDLVLSVCDPSAHAHR